MSHQKRVVIRLYLLESQVRLDAAGETVEAANYRRAASRFAGWVGRFTWPAVAWAKGETHQSATEFEGMQLFGRNIDTEVALVAEVGVNHEGDSEAALRLVRLAAEAGADAVKFQTFTPARFASASDPERLARVTKFALDEPTHARLAHAAEAQGIVFFSTAVSEDVVPLLDRLCPAIKIASGDLNFEPVIRAAARTGKPVILSTGLGTVEEIDRAVAWVGEEVGHDRLAERLVLMHCVSSYPTPIEQANVRSVPFLADRYLLPVGYSNHVLGPEAPLAAVALGAKVIEVHFTDSRENRSFRDHALSFEPGELADLKSRIARVRASLGDYQKRRMPCEESFERQYRKGVVAARDLTAGAVLSREDLMFARPAVEFPAAEIEGLVGRRLIRATRLGELILRAAIE